MGQDKTKRDSEKLLSKQRGYADFFDWPDKSDKERGIARAFFEELERDTGRKTVCATQHPGGENHAPDCQAVMDTGEVWGIEITELVSQKAIEGTKLGESVLAVWPDCFLVAKFEALIARKDRPEHVRGGPYNRYVLLVHVDEDMLLGTRLKVVLGSRCFRTHLIDDIYVLTSYEPDEKRLPLLHFETEKSTA